MNTKSFSMTKKVLCMVALALLISAPAFAINIDGRIESGEYTNSFDVNFTVEGGDKADPNDDIPISDKGKIWFYQESNKLSVAFIQPLSLIDNSYGDNQVGWGSNAPSGKDHELKHLADSDDADFFFDYGDDGISFTIDYAANKVSSSDDLFKAIVSGADASKVLEASSSLRYNWTKYGTTVSSDANYNLFNATYDTKKSNWKAGDGATSPLTNSDTTYDIVDPGLKDWVFEVIYEFVVELDSDSTFVPESLNITMVHDSPNKIGKNEVYTDLAQPVPEPATMLLLGTGLIALAGFRKKFKKS